ncbi:MAG: di-trans,poly-cis-decaprenylcistransferase [Spirochaetales bacterium]|nr:di-trans,poly-cis-decaprenylcistransferase [Spirochaetales bacterium]
MIDKNRLPAHIGIIMDGNGRWAQQQKKPRTFGHNEGVKTAKRIVRAASELGIEYLTLYVFSTENWKRTKREVSFLMGLIQNHLRNELDFYRKYRIRVIYSGDNAGLPPHIIKELHGVQEDTAHFTELTVNLAINYGGKNEIVRAVNKWLYKVNNEKKKTGNGQITQEDIQMCLDHPEIPPIDLVIRTAGEKRLSNFFIWECAYAEFYFSPKLWPDWEKEDLFNAIMDYQKRERRFGAVL